MPENDLIPESLVTRLRNAESVMLLSGSGISAASGVPTFRDAQTGIWARFRPEELATPEAFAVNPERVWRWYRWRRETVSKAKPNAAHFACVALGNLFNRMHLVTQNVDGLHQAAGASDVIEYHGNIYRERCSNGHVAHSSSSVRDNIPACETCGALMRPDVVWFGEPIPAAVLEAADFAARDCEVFLSVGTSAVVYPANTYADLARAHGATLVEINTAETPLSQHSDYCLRGPADELLPRLVAELADRQINCRAKNAAFPGK